MKFANRHLGADARALLPARLWEHRAEAAFDPSWFHPLPLYCPHHRQWKDCAKGYPAAFPPQPSDRDGRSRKDDWGSHSICGRLRGAAVIGFKHVKGHCRRERNNPLSFPTAGKSSPCA